MAGYGRVDANTSYEATAFQPLIAHSPLLSWLYHIFGVRALAADR